MNPFLFLGKAISHDALYTKGPPQRRDLLLHSPNKPYINGGLKLSSMDPLMTSSPNITPTNATPVGCKAPVQFYNPAQSSTGILYF